MVEPKWLKKNPRPTLKNFSYGTPTNVDAFFSKTNLPSKPTLTLEDKLEVETHMVQLWIVLRKVMRNLLIATVLSFILPGVENGVIMIYPFKPLILQLLNLLIDHINSSFSNTTNVDIIIGSPLTPLSLYINVALFMGLIISIPFSIKDISGFIRPGLTDEEFNTIKTVLQASVFLFLTGAIITYALIMPQTLSILVGSGNLIGEQTLLQMYNLDSMLNLMIWGTLGGGLLYAAPLILVALVNLRIISAVQIANRRKEVLFAVFVLAAIITPDPTIISMIILSLPMILVIEFIVSWCFRIERKQLLELM